MEQFWGVRLKKIMIFEKITILRATLLFMDVFVLKNKYYRYKNRILC